VLVVRDEGGNVIRRVSGVRSKGTHRVAWDLRLPASTPIDLRPQEDLLPWMRSPAGPMVAPGTYSVELTKNVDGIVTTLGEPASFQVVPLEQATFAARNRAQVLAFRKKAARLRRAVRGAMKVAADVQSRLNYIRKAIVETPSADRSLLAETESLQTRLNLLQTELRGDRTAAKREEPVPMSIQSRINDVTSNQWYVSSPPTKTQEDGYHYAAEAFARVLADLKTLVETDLAALESKLDEAGAPWTPGRFPTWEME